jgi:adenine phosphoribosyltransferase
MAESSPDIKNFIRDVADFPKPGITFKDITPLLANPQALGRAIDALAESVSELEIDVIAAAEARGFLFAVPLALKMGIPMVPIRKPGKLPYKKHSYSYDLEYGSDTLEMHIDAVSQGQNVLVVDDLLATGGTVEACCRMIEDCGGHVAGCLFLIELGFLGGKKKLEKYPTISVLNYD